MPPPPPPGVAAATVAPPHSSASAPFGRSSGTIVVRPASVVAARVPPHLAAHPRCLRELAFAALLAAGGGGGAGPAGDNGGRGGGGLGGGGSFGGSSNSRGVCRGVTLHAVPAGGGKENGGRGTTVAVASVQMSSVEGARFLAAAWNAAALACGGGGGARKMRSYVVLPRGVADDDDEEEEDVDAGMALSTSNRAATTATNAAATVNGVDGVDAEVIERVRRVERGLLEQYEEASKRAAAIAAKGGAGDGAKDGADASASGGDASKEKRSKEDEKEEGEEAEAAPTQANNNAVVKIDVSKVAAAAGGGEYDEDSDPLNAPEVLAAVAAFRRRNHERDAHLRRRRVEIVDRRLAEETPRARARLLRWMEEARAKAEADRAARAVMASAMAAKEESGVPPAAAAAAPPPAKEGDVTTTDAASAAGGGAVDTGKRGVSNLPAWLSKTGGAAAPTAGSTEAAAGPPPYATKADGTEAGEEDESNPRKRKFVPSEANRDVNTRKQRIDAGGGMSMAEIRAANEAADKKKAAAATTAAAATATTKGDILKAGVTFPPVPAGSVPKMKQYVTDQIVELLGEAEDSMINFVLGALTVPKSPAGCLVSSMLEEMQPVLDEDAEDFVVDLYRTVAGLA